MRNATLAATAAAAVLAVAGTAAAGTASLAETHAENGTLMGVTIRYVAAPGETNDAVVQLTRSVTGVQVAVRDSGAPVTAGRGFTAAGPGEAVALVTSDPPNGFATSVALGDGADSLLLELAGSELGDAYLAGGSGNDELLVGPRTGGGVTLLGGTGSDLLDAGAGGGAVSYADHTRPVRVDLDGVDDDGSAGERDRLRNVQIVWGGAGNDVLVGDGGANRLFGRRGADTIRGGGGADTMDGEWGADALFGDGGADIVGGGDGNDRVRGGAGSDRLSGDAGADELFARDGAADRVYGGRGSDRAQIDRGLDVVRGVERRR
jgi:Ca2+-binding RTX toxin-like protein